MMELELDTMSQSGNTKETKPLLSFDSQSSDLEDVLKVDNYVDFVNKDRNNDEKLASTNSDLEYEENRDNLSNSDEVLDNNNNLFSKSNTETENTDDVLEELANVVEVKKDEDNDLPDGWVRQGNGLKIEFPNTPKNSLENNLESKNLFINFTDRDPNIRSQNSLQNALMNLDRSAVKELKGGLVAIRANKPHSCKSDLNNCDHYPVKTSNHFGRRRCNTGYTKGNSTQLLNLESSRRNYTFSFSDNYELEVLKAQHKKELEQTKQNLLAHVEDLVKKYRELAVDAVNAARNEQLKCQEECKQAYSTAYNACLKYEKDLKNTVKFALKEYQNNVNDNHQILSMDKSELLKNNQNHKYFNNNTQKSLKHNLLREDLSYDYQVDEQLLTNFETKVVEKFNNFVDQLSLYLEENYNFNHKDSNDFVKSVISTNLS